MTAQTLDRGGSAVLSLLRPAGRLVAGLVRREAIGAPRVFGEVEGAGTFERNSTTSSTERLEIMTLPGLARYLLRSYPTALRVISNGQIPAFRIGSDWRVRRVGAGEGIAKGGRQR
jgi:excisionase family DNA binding protein